MAAIKDFVQKLLACKTDEERNKLVLENTTLIDEAEGGEWKTKFDELKVKFDGAEEWKTKHDELQKKFIDTFFSGSKNTTTQPTTQKTIEEVEKEKAEAITIDSLFEEPTK